MEFKHRKQKKIRNNLRLLMFDQIFFSQRVKRYEISTYKHGIYELPQELLNELGLRILEN